MLSNELMGLLCLATLWTTALLVAGAALQDMRDVWSFFRRARRALRGTIESAKGDVFAEWRVEQRGRALDAKEEAIAFHDRTFESSLEGGSVRIQGELYAVQGPGDVWATAEARTRAAVCADRATFDAAYAQATRAAGWQREVRVCMRPGDDVFVLGEIKDGTITGASGPLVVSSFDPARRFAFQLSAIAGFIVAELVACAAVTSIAVAPPLFGARSIVGAVLCLGFFLGVTPLAVALRESVRRPSEAFQRGTWRRGSVA